MRQHALKRVLVVASCAAAMILTSINPATPAHAYDPDTFRGTNGVGIQTLNMKSEGWGVTMEQVEASYKRASDLGISWTRIVVPWYYIQRDHYRNEAPANWDWRTIDQSVEVASRYNMKVLMQVTTAPTWATGLDGLPAAQRAALPTHEDTWAPKPEHYGDYANFLAETIKRYSPKGILDYEIWNEPGQAGFWKNSIADPLPNPEAYTALLKVAYPKAKQANAKSNIIAGGAITFGPSKDGTFMDSLAFTKRMYEAGAQGNFDALSHHPYGILAPTWDWNGWHYLNGDEPSVKNSKDMPETLIGLMDKYGDGDKPIWITEVGRTSSPDGKRNEEAQQAQAIEAYLNAWHKFDKKRLGPIILYQDVDYHHYGQKGANEESFFGITRVDGSAKPAADVIKKFTAANPAPSPSPSRRAATPRAAVRARSVAPRPFAAENRAPDRQALIAADSDVAPLVEVEEGAPLPAIATSAAPAPRPTPAQTSAPTAYEPAPSSAARPIAERPVADRPAAAERLAAAERPAAQRPVADRPAERPVAERPVAERPGAHRPAAERPVAERPVAERPAAQRPVAERPAQAAQQGTSRAVRAQAAEPNPKPAPQPAKVKRPNPAWNRIFISLQQTWKAAMKMLRWLLGR